MNVKFFQDAVDVYFKAFGDRAFSVSSVFCEFTLGGREFSIKWYGVIIAFGFLLAVLFGGRTAYKWKMNLDKMVDVLIYSTILGIIGARLYYVIFQWDNYKDNLLDIFKIWNGGLAIYGGIIGGLLGAYLVCRVRKLNFYNLLDIAAMSLLIGQGIGRWGNFANQEAFGTNTSLPWGMWSMKVAQSVYYNNAELAQRGIEMDPSGFVHPTFLYESIWCIAGFFLLFLICRKFRKFSGQIFLSYGIWYGVGRMIIEGLRTDSLYLGSSNIRVSQLLSALLVLACLAALFVLMIKYTKSPKPIEGVDFFPENEEKKPKKKAKSRKNAKKTASENSVSAAKTADTSGETSVESETPAVTETAPEKSENCSESAHEQPAAQDAEPTEQDS